MTRALLDIGFVLGGLVLGLFVIPALRPRRRSPMMETWRVEVAEPGLRCSYQSICDVGRHQVPGSTVVVNLVRGKRRVKIAELKAVDEDFDHKLTAAMQKAEERATTLEAVELEAGMNAS